MLSLGLYAILAQCIYSHLSILSPAIGVWRKEDGPNLTGHRCIECAFVSPSLPPLSCYLFVSFSLLLSVISALWKLLPHSAETEVYYGILEGMSDKPLPDLPVWTLALGALVKYLLLSIAIYISWIEHLSCCSVLVLCANLGYTFWIEAQLPLTHRVGLLARGFGSGGLRRLHRTKTAANRNWVWARRLTQVVIESFNLKVFIPLYFTCISLQVNMLLAVLSPCIS